MELIKLVEFQKLCKFAKLIEIVNSRTNGYKSIDMSEGIELVCGKIQLFEIITMKDGTKEKVICETVRSEQINSVIGAFLVEKPIVKEMVTNEHKNETVSIPENKAMDEKVDQKAQETDKPNSINSIPAILESKRIIVNQDILDWKGKSVFERLLWVQKTPKNLIKKRRGNLKPEYAGRDKKSLTDENYNMFSYVEGNVMKQEANIVFCWNWSAVVESEKYFENEVVVRGYFQVEIEGKMVRRPCAGSGIKKGLMDWGDTTETAITEMTKRGLKSFGFNPDVYSGDLYE